MLRSALFTSRDNEKEPPTISFNWIGAQPAAVKYLPVCLLLLLPLLAHAESQTVSTDGGTLDVRVTYENIIPGEPSPILIEFVNPNTGRVQEHIDYSIMLTNGDQILFGTALTHSSTGFIRGLSVTFPGEGEYVLDVAVEGILFNPIERQSASLSIPVAQQGGGCLIATAAYGSELAPQVQKLREIRDQKVLTTPEGRSFMDAFHHVYYVFSPTVADMERESQIFRGLVYVLIQPMLASLSLLEYAASGSAVLALGTLVILLNVFVYVAGPALTAFCAARRSGMVRRV